jgi:hypothetical protein
MKHYTKPTIEIARIDSGESIMVVSSVNINPEKIVKATDKGINTLSNWHS